ncbi:hydrophobic W protein [Pilibacter termitis]|uniref:Hydrophobic W protein n=1 Tax=Pilibacter termitis TaxID=263852 RepID=A0A1T4RHN1_9ENTE|nr:hypothetical protein [Pilibacter termitis]SKA15417.1 hydrophobic W protein [Pilibacter termitis]
MKKTTKLICLAFTPLLMLFNGAIANAAVLEDISIRNSNNKDLGQFAKVFVGDKGEIIFNPLDNLPSEKIYGPTIKSSAEQSVKLEKIGKGQKFSWKALKKGKAGISVSGMYSQETIDEYLKLNPNLSDLSLQEISIPHSITVYNRPTTTYSVHGQNYGWSQGSKSSGVLGTTGKSLRLEALKLNINTQGLGGNVEFRVHGQNYGWSQGWKKNGQTLGTTGRSLRLEAVEMKLTGEVAKHFDIAYRVHGQNYGWQNWKKNGETAGTTGKSLRLEAVEIKLVRK